MKPISIAARDSLRFLLTDWNYQPMTLGGYQGRCIKTGVPSFRNISRQYFQHDARRDFVGEVFFFAAIVATAVVPLLSIASALANFD